MAGIRPLAPVLHWPLGFTWLRVRSDGDCCFDVCSFEGFVFCFLLASPTFICEGIRQFVADAMLRHEMATTHDVSCACTREGDDDDCNEVVAAFRSRVGWVQARMLEPGERIDWMRNEGPPYVDTAST